MKTPPPPAYWALDLFVGAMIVLLFVAVTLANAAWRRAIDVAWVMLLALGIHIWCASNRRGLAAEDSQLDERSHHTSHRRRSEVIDADHTENQA